MKENINNEVKEGGDRVDEIAALTMTMTMTMTMTNLNQLTLKT